MKKGVLLLIIAGGIFYFWSNKPFTSDNEELTDLKMELEAKESILHQMKIDIEQIVANARPKCEGGTVEVTVDETPLLELKEDIERLKKKIAGAGN